MMQESPPAFSAFSRRTGRQSGSRFNSSRHQHLACPIDRALTKLTVTSLSHRAEPILAKHAATGNMTGTKKAQNVATPFAPPSAPKAAARHPHKTAVHPETSDTWRAIFENAGFCCP